MFSTMNSKFGFAPGCLYRGSVSWIIGSVVVLRHGTGIKSRPV